MLDPVVLRRNRWKKLPWAFLWERSNVEKAAIVLFNTTAEEEKAKRCGWHLPQTTCRDICYGNIPSLQTLTGAIVQLVSAQAQTPVVGEVDIGVGFPTSYK
jgi:hypothetical protein